MDESMQIKKRQYGKIFNEITDTLYEYVINKNIGISMIRTGVTYNDTREIISIVADSYTTIATFLVETETMKVVQVTINQNSFNGYFGVFKLTDKKKITDYLNSFEGTILNLYSKGDNYE